MTDQSVDPAKLVVVLSNQFGADGQPNAESLNRLQRACELVRADPRAILVTSGWGRSEAPDRTIAAAMADAATARHDLGPDRILQSPNARDTVGDAVFLARDIWVPRSGMDQVTVVTGGDHAKRAEAIFEFVFAGQADVRVTPSSPVPGALSRADEASLEQFRQTFSGVAAGDLKAIEARMWLRHPFYNGEIYGTETKGASQTRA